MFQVGKRFVLIDPGGLMNVEGKREKRAIPCVLASEHHAGPAGE